MSGVHLKPSEFELRRRVDQDVLYALAIAFERTLFGYLLHILYRVQAVNAGSQITLNIFAPFQFGNGSMKRWAVQPNEAKEGEKQSEKLNGKLSFLVSFVRGVWQDAR